MGEQRRKRRMVGELRSIANERLRAWARRPDLPLGDPRVALAAAHRGAHAGLAGRGAAAPAGPGEVEPADPAAPVAWPRRWRWASPPDADPLVPRRAALAVIGGAAADPVCPLAPKPPAATLRGAAARVDRSRGPGAPRRAPALVRLQDGGRRRRRAGGRRVSPGLRGAAVRASARRTRCSAWPTGSTWWTCGSWSPPS